MRRFEAHNRGRHAAFQVIGGPAQRIGQHGVGLAQGEEAFHGPGIVRVDVGMAGKRPGPVGPAEGLGVGVGRNAEQRIRVVRHPIPLQRPGRRGRAPRELRRVPRYLANPTARFSRMTVTRIWPG